MSRQRSLPRRAANVALYVCYLLGVVGVLVYVFAYRPFIAELKQRPNRYGYNLTPAKHISHSTMLRLGFYNSGSSLRFSNFETSKRPGVVRICTLGDSNTAGSEVGPQDDYPSFLQREFEALGVRNVEVINFANGWYGFSQIAVMFNEVARPFDCDVVLLLAYDFWSRRDATFNHTFLRAPYYLHARYVISGDTVDLVEVAGRTTDERFSRYFSFIPLWRYLRYDREAPAAIRALLPNDREINNPLYYMDDSRAETWEIYRRLLDGMARAGPPIVVMLARKDAMTDPLMQVRSKNISFAVQEKLSGEFPYKAPIWHWSPWGQQLMARRFLRVLLAPAPAPMPILKLVDVPGAADWQDPVPLNNATSLTVNTDRGETGAVVSVHDRDEQNEQRHRATFAGSDTQGLLAFRAPGESILDSCMVPLSRRIVNSDRAYVIESGVHVSELGKPEQAAQGLALWVIERKGVSCRSHGPLEVPVDPARDGGNAVIKLGANTLSARWNDGRLVFGGPREPLYRFRAFGHVSADVKSLPETGHFKLVFQGPDGIRSATLSQWRLQDNVPDISILRRGNFEVQIESGHARVIRN